MAAVKTEEERGKATPVQEKQGLLTAFNPCLDCIKQFVGEDRKTILLPQVHYPYRWKRQLVDPVREGEISVFTCDGIMIRFKRGGGGTQYYNGAGQLCPHYGNIAGIESETFFLFVCLLMLLIYYHKAKFINRRKDG